MLTTATLTITPCTACKGYGSVPCDKCNGAGVRGCGDACCGYFNCQHCEGTGARLCACEGRGYFGIVSIGTPWRPWRPHDGDVDA